MEVKNISTILNTKSHRTIASRYERMWYEDDEQMLEDFKNNVELQYTTYDDDVEMFVVVVDGLKDGETVVDMKQFPNDSSAQDVIDYVNTFFE